MDGIYKTEQGEQTAQRTRTETRGYTHQGQGVGVQGTKTNAQLSACLYTTCRSPLLLIHRMGGGQTDTAPHFVLTIARPHRIPFLHSYRERYVLLAQLHLQLLPTDAVWLWPVVVVLPAPRRGWVYRIYDGFIAQIMGIHCVNYGYIAKIMGLSHRLQVHRIKYGVAEKTVATAQCVKSEAVMMD